MRKAIGQVRRILKPGGVRLFNPYGARHTWPFPEGMPPVAMWDEQSVRRLFPDTKWEMLDLQHACGGKERDGELLVEHTLRVLVRKR